MTAGTATNPKEALISEVRTEYERMQLRIRELQTLIDQSQAEVRRLQERSVNITTQMNRLEANFETVPRSDIKAVYTAAIDTKTRLLTMQGQVDKVQQDRAQLEGFSKTLKHLLDTLEGVPAAGITTGQNGSAVAVGLDGETVIRMVESQEAERQRLAVQMHNGPAQSLTNFILQAEICRKLFDRNPDRAAEELDNLKTAASTTFKKVRDFIFELRPMMLDDLGLIPTVKRYITAYEEKSNIQTRVNVLGDERQRIEAHAEVTMFRGLQEILTYARDVSGSTKVEVVLDISNDAAKATVDFNGKNLEETEAAQTGRDKVFGLSSLRDRVELIGGTVELASDDELNRVEISIPLVGE
jgi:two-component system, NarL family, sensor histidine kinase DegS